MKTIIFVFAVVCNTYAGLTLHNSRFIVEEKMRSLYKVLDVPADAIQYLLKKEPLTRARLQDAWSILIDSSKTVKERKTLLRHLFPQEAELVDDVVPIYEGIHRLILRHFPNYPDRGESFFSHSYGLLMDDTFLDATQEDRQKMLLNLIERYQRFL